MSYREALTTALVVDSSAISRRKLAMAVLLVAIVVMLVLVLPPV